MLNISICTDPLPTRKHVYFLRDCRVDMFGRLTAVVCMMVSSSWLMWGNYFQWLLIYYNTTLLTSSFQALLFHAYIIPSLWTQHVQCNTDIKYPDRVDLITIYYPKAGKRIVLHCSLKFNRSDQFFLQLTWHFTKCGNNIWRQNSRILESEIQNLSP